jgi:hypothetical protein
LARTRDRVIDIPENEHIRFAELIYPDSSHDDLLN